MTSGWLASRRATIVSLLVMVASIATALTGLYTFPYRQIGLDQPPLVIAFGKQIAPHIVAWSLVVAAVLAPIIAWGRSPAAPPTQPKP